MQKRKDAVRVYVVMDIKGNIVYCGSTTMPLQERWYRHVSNKGGAMYEAIKEHGKDYYSIDEVARCVDRESAFLIEEHLTRDLMEKGMPLLNTDFGNRLSEEHKRKIGEANKGKIHPETRKPVKDSNDVIYPCISVAAQMTGAKHQNISACLSGRRKSAAGRKWQAA